MFTAIETGMVNKLNDKKTQQNWIISRLYQVQEARRPRSPP